MARSFNISGSGQYVSFPMSPALEPGTGDFSVSFWAKIPPNPSTARDIFNKGLNDRDRIVFPWTSGNALGFAIEDGTTIITNVVPALGVYDDNQWHHWVAVREFGVNIRVYIDGVLLTTPTADTVGEVDDPEDLIIGSGNNTSTPPTRHLEVEVADFAWFDRAFDADDAQAIAAGVSAKFFSPTFYAPLDGLGATERDLVGGLQGTLTNAPPVADSNPPIAYGPGLLSFYRTHALAIEGSVGATSSVPNAQLLNLVALGGSVAASASNSATPSYAGAFEGTIAADATLSANLGGQVVLAGSIATAASLTGDIDGAVVIAGSFSVTSSLSGDNVRIRLSEGTVAATSTFAGDTQVQGALYGNVVSVAALSAGLGGQVVGAGNIAAVGSLAGDIDLKWHYECDPTVSNVHAVRFLVGDTDPADRLLGKREIEYLLDTYGSVMGAAAAAASSLCAKFTREVDLKVGDVSESKSQKAAAYKALADELRYQLSVCAEPVFGGTSVATKEAWAALADLVQPQFIRDQFDSKRGANLSKNTKPREDGNW